MYSRYLSSLLEYLLSFCSRIKPLFDLSSEFDTVKESFETKWEAMEFPGWGKEAGSAMTHTGAHLDLSAFSSSDVSSRYLRNVIFTESMLSLLA